MRAVNLIPVEQRTGAPVGAGRSQGGAYAVLALIAGLAIMAVLYGKADHAVSSQQSQVASLTAEAQRAEASAARLAPYTSFVATSEQRLQAVQTLLESRFDWAHVFHEFGRVLPRGTSLSSLTGSVGGTSNKAPAKTGGSAVASATPPGSVPTFSLTGCAVNQAAVAALLERLRLIDGVSEVELESSTASAAGGGAASSGASSGGCPAQDPAYTVAVTFDALPSASAVAAASAPTATVSDRGGPSAPATSVPSAGKTGVTAR